MVTMPPSCHMVETGSYCLPSSRSVVATLPSSRCHMVDIWCCGLPSPGRGRLPHRSLPIGLWLFEAMESLTLLTFPRNRVFAQWDVVVGRSGFFLPLTAAIFSSTITLMAGEPIDRPRHVDIKLEHLSASALTLNSGESYSRKKMSYPRNKMS